MKPARLRPKPKLTVYQEKLLSLVSQGHTNPEIAIMEGKSPSHISIDKTRLKSKLPKSEQWKVEYAQLRKETGIINEIDTLIKTGRSFTQIREIKKLDFYRLKQIFNILGKDPKTRNRKRGPSKKSAVPVTPAKRNSADSNMGTQVQKERKTRPDVYNRRLNMLYDETQRRHKGEPPEVLRAEIADLELRINGVHDPNIRNELVIEMNALRNLLK